MSERVDRPLSHWTAVARMGFERDFHRIFTDLGMKRSELARRIGASAPYVSKILNAEHGNFQLETMCKLARAIGAIVQVRLVKEGSEAVRVVDYETAAELDDATARRLEATESHAPGDLLSFRVSSDVAATPAAGSTDANGVSVDTAYATIAGS